MNLAINIIFLVITGGLAAVFLVNLLINLFRAILVNKQLKKNPLTVDGKIIDIQQSKSRIKVIVEFVSPTNRNKFQESFELSTKKFGDQYTVGQDIKLYYADVKDLKKVNCFPVYLEGQKMGVDAASVFTDAFLLAGGLYVFIMLLISMITKKIDADGIAHIGLEKNALPLIAMLSRFNGEVYVDSNGATLAVTSGIFLIIIVFFYVLLFPYIKERFLGMSTAHKNSYLKLYGVKGMAEVKTFKFTHGKGPNNEKESYLTIEFDDVNGKTVTTHLSSYLYSESQEQYIDILYDEKNPNNVVYMRK